MSEDKKEEGWTTHSSTSIYKKLAQVMGLIPSIEKTGLNTFHKYKYVEEEAILNILRKVLPEVGICAYNTLVSANIEDGEATVHNLLVIVDVDTGDRIEIKSIGYAHDKKGDKAVYKAWTGATKYGYLKGFCLPTGDDPERDEVPVSKNPDTMTYDGKSIFKGTREILGSIIFELFGGEKLVESKKKGMIRFFKENHIDHFNEWVSKFQHEPETIGDALGMITIIDDERVHPTHVREWKPADVARVNAEVERRN